MKYISTRGQAQEATFSEVVRRGMAPDGGLYLPDSLPDFSGRLEELAAMDYVTLAHALMTPFVDIPADKLRSLLERSYSGFNGEDVTSLREVGPFRVLELFHGPSLAFKDIALQLLGNLLEDLLGQDGDGINVLCATSGDTGSAAIQALKGREGLRIFVMHPDGKVSESQARQMTTVLDDNVFNMAVRGTFDDCQSILKKLLGDKEFSERHSLGAVNSVNWARLLAQIPYYFQAALRTCRETDSDRVIFSVPTGNFGDVFAGYLARTMGCPIERLVAATNSNDILARFFNTGKYERGQVDHTHSPAMDIQIASNFERYLYYLLDCRPEQVREHMQRFTEDGTTCIDQETMTLARQTFTGTAVNAGDTLAAIRRYREEHDYTLDPHTAVGVCAGENLVDAGFPVVVLGTAAPAKFGETIRLATGSDPAPHPVIERLRDLPTRCESLPPESGAVADFITDRAAP